MPIPKGAHQAPGEPNRIILPSGDRVTRYRALNIGAREMGYASHHEYRKPQRGGSHTARDQKYYDNWLGTDAGQHARETARAMGVTNTELKRDLIAARNSRPHGPRIGNTGKYAGGGKPGGAAYQDFMEEYDLMDYGDDWVDY
jgi:hypothetical protein